MHSFIFLWLCKVIFDHYVDFYMGFFLQELKFVFPNAQQMNRGGQVSRKPNDFRCLEFQCEVIQFIFDKKQTM